MGKEEIVKIIMEAKTLREEDFYSPVVFYYLAGRLPELSVSQCADAVDSVRILMSGRKSNQ